MNKSERTTILSAIVISSLLATAFVFIGSMNLSHRAAGQAEEVFGENATFTEEVEGTGAITNQTAAAPPTNQTAATPTNLTSSDIEPVRDSLNTAREGLQSNDAQAAIEALNNADGSLFDLRNEEPKGPLSDQLSTLQDNIDTARESLRGITSLQGNDIVKVLQDLNAADSQVLAITEMLPTEEAVEEEGEGEEE